MTVESTLRGAGRNASGSTVAWYRTVEWLMANGPATFDQIMAGCAEFIDAGYARRALLENRRSKQRHKAAKAGGELSRKVESSPCAAEIDLDDARHFVMQRNLNNGLRSIIAKHGDQYQALRLPKPPAGLTAEQITADPVAQRKAMTEQQLIVAMRKARPRLVGNQGKLNRAEKDVILAWLDLRDPTAPGFTP